MAEQTPAATSTSGTTTPNASGAARAAGPDSAAPPAEHAPNQSSEPRSPTADPNTRDAQADKDPMRELLETLQRAQPLTATLDRNLAQTIHTLTQQGADPERRAQPGFRHQLAYALQDLEKLPVWPIQMDRELRSEMTHLSATAPGLENQRMLALMRTTAALEDKQLIREIRRTATQVGEQVTQNTSAIETEIEALENRVRLTRRPAEPPTNPRYAASERPQEANTARGSDPAARHEPAPQQARTAQQAYPRGALDTIFHGMRPSDQGPGAPWNPPPTPMAGRLAAFESRMQESRDERTLGRAEKSGRAALDALDAFRTGEGAIVVNRIRAAARSEPGGIAAVLSEMREGGRFADLRQQFNNALETERGITAAYDKAAAALARYGQDRTAIEQVIARRPDAANLSAKFEQMDAQIGEAAAGTPSRRDGKSMVDDLAQKAAELLQRAVDAVKSVFNRSPSADARTRTAPAPSMSV
jgi:hypothetical protein